MKSLVSVLAVFLGALVTQAADAESKPKKQIFAHYMGCYPAANLAIPHHYRQQMNDVDPRNTSSFLHLVGGAHTNFPLIPQEWYYGGDHTWHESIELDIRRAMRIGIDGFAIDAWAGGDGAKKAFETMLEVCKDNNLPFSVTICLDPACHGPASTDIADDRAEEGSKVAAITETLRYLLKFKDHPNLARRDGKVLIFSYQTCSIMSLAKKNEGEGTTEPKRWRNFLEMLQGLRNVARKEFATELYMHMDMDYSFPGKINLANIEGSRPPHEPGPMIAEMAGYLAKGEEGLEPFDAVGGFMGVNWRPEWDLVAKKVKAAGGEWASPLFFQYNNKMGALHVEPGTNLMREIWDRIRRNDSTLLQFVTWNDYGENTILAPGTQTRYTIFELTGYQIAWWKTGHPPKLDRDKVFLIYRRYTNDAKTFPFHARRRAEGVLEVCTLLTEPATIRLPGRPETYEAPAGLFIKQFPLLAGEVAAEVVRNGEIALKVVSPDPVTDKPFREMNEMICYSSEFDRQWALDFPGIPPETYAENGDADGDGLPNWFEMLWFGQMGKYSTATDADPNADADGDGKSNLQEYRDQSDPLQPTEAYKPGYVWDLSHIHNLGFSFNPDRDTTGRDVWHYLHKVGETPVPLDGNYAPLPNTAPRFVPYAGAMSHHSEAKHPEFRSAHGWIARHKDPADDSWLLQLRTGANISPIIAWESPVDGTVSVALTTASQPPRPQPYGPATLTVQRSNPLETLEECAVNAEHPTGLNIPSVKVKPGDRIYIIGSSPRGQDVRLDEIKIELVKLGASAGS